MQIPANELDDVVKRLRRVEGQIGGIIRMIEEGRECKDVVTQMSAASKAMSKASYAVIATGLRFCQLTDDAETREDTMRELERLFLSLA